MSSRPLSTYGRTITDTDVWGKTTTTSYDGIGRAATTVGPDGTLRSFLDPAGRAIGQYLDGNIVARANLDAAGRLVAVSYPSGTGTAGNGTAGSLTANSGY